MRVTIIIFLLPIFFINGMCQHPPLLRHNLNVGFFGSSFGNPERGFLILTSSYEYRSKALKDKLGVGLVYTYVNVNNIKQKEFAFGPRINYHFFVGEKLDPYIGISGVLNQRKYSIDKIDKSYQIKYQAGLKYSIFRHLDLFLELSNYRYKALDSKRKGGFYPNIGLSLK
jgi:hypothetical protein